MEIFKVMQNRVESCFTGDF